MSRGGRGSKIYVGNLPTDIRERDLEDLFSKVKHEKADIQQHDQTCKTVVATTLFSPRYSMVVSATLTLKRP